jgi:hypothetical protein
LTDLWTNGMLTPMNKYPYLEFAIAHLIVLISAILLTRQAAGHNEMINILYVVIVFVATLCVPFSLYMTKVVRDTHAIWQKIKSRPTAQWVDPPSANLADVNRVNMALLELTTSMTCLIAMILMASAA